VAIGAISATITQQQTCHREFEKDSLEFKKLSDEIPGRNKLLYKKLAETNDENEYNRQVELFTSGEAFFVYSEYERKTITELSLIRSMLAKKLHPVWIGKNLLVCNFELQRTETDIRTKSGHCHSVDDEPTVEVENEPRQGKYGTNNAASPFDWGLPHARGFGSKAQDEYFEYLKANAFKTYLAYSGPHAYVDKGEYWEVPSNCSLKQIWAKLLGF
jgi:hypothetical protein